MVVKSKDIFPQNAMIIQALGLTLPSTRLVFAVDDSMGFFNLKGAVDEGFSLVNG